MEAGHKIFEDILEAHIGSHIKSSILAPVLGDMQISPLLAGLAQTMSFVRKLSSTCGVFQPLANLKWTNSCKPAKARICATCSAQETYKLIDRRSAFRFFLVLRFCFVNVNKKETKMLLPVQLRQERHW